ncbi:hypothetical protein BSIN_2608 [Burkholderia singularis]|uniref:Uncharacterized protein n=1 Tax=Burkholderia singularis TaxID=1503053 RepID=A0A238HC44_9BURK|nr:hypothetical protein BSIN_2608 [Burkholderia singularis]
MRYRGIGDSVPSTRGHECGDRRDGRLRRPSRAGSARH